MSFWKAKSMKSSRLAALLMLATMFGLMAVAVVIQVTTGGNAELVTLLALILTGVVGALLVSRVPGNRVGWALAFGGVAGGLAGLAASVIPSTQTPLEAVPDLSSSQVVVGFVLGSIGWYGLLAVWLIAVPLWFPSGRPPTPRWRWVAWVGFLFLTVTFVFSALDTELCDQWQLADSFYPATVTSVRACFDNPFGMANLPDGESGLLGGFLIILGMSAFIGAFASLAVRFRRGGPVERLQIKSLLFSLGLVVGSFVISAAGEAILGRDPLAGFEWAAGILFAGIPLSIAVAVLRYRLYDLERVISRTIGYSLVVIALGSVYIVGAVWLPSRLFSEQPPLFVAGSTLAVVTLFNPVRTRVLHWVDRRFYRARYDAEQVVSRFSEQLRGGLDLDHLTEDWVAVVNQTMHPSSVGVWVKQAR